MDSRLSVLLQSKLKSHNLFNESVSKFHSLSILVLQLQVRLESTPSPVVVGSAERSMCTGAADLSFSEGTVIGRRQWSAGSRT